MVSNDQPQENKSAVDNAVEKGKEMADKAWEMLPQGLKDSVQEMHALVDTETAKEVVYKNGGNPEYAGLAAKTSLESRDPLPLDQYLREIDKTGASKISPEDQLAVLKAAQRSRPEDYDSIQREPNKFDETAKTYELVARLPEAQKAMVKEYQDGLAQGYYKNNVPAFIKGLPMELQQDIHDKNPDGFAKSFPDSELTKGEELKKLVDMDISDKFGGTAMRMKDSFVGRRSSVLDNPNLTSEQVNNLAKTFLTIGYDGKPERNPDYFQATEAVSQTFMKFYRNDKLSPSNKSAMVDRFGKNVGVNA